MHYYRHHIGDFKQATDMLTDSQAMAYLRMIWMYYDTEEPLPDDSKKLAFMLKSDPATIELLLEHFFTYRDGRWSHERCDQEIAGFRARSESARRSAKHRWDAQSMRTHSDRNANASKNDADLCVSDANQYPITNNQEENRAKTAKRFVPPTVDEVASYCKERKNLVDSERFVNFYSAKGWMVGKNRMKDWKAAVRTWEKSSGEQTPRRRKML
jgi:uncharacterized protein YdaU (DUF1376 family)